MEDAAAQRAAENLLAAHRANLPFKRLGPPDEPAAIADAYDIQEKYVALLRREHGDVAGYKVGLTSAAMQAFCGIDHPIGVLCSQNACANPALWSGVRISVDWAWNLKSLSASNRTSRSRTSPMPPT